MALDYLNLEDLEFLDDTLEKYASARSLHNVVQLEGYFTAVVSGPLVVYEHWYPDLFGGVEPDWESSEEAERFHHLVLRQVNVCAHVVSLYPDKLALKFEHSLNNDQGVVVREWCRGYIRGAAMAGWVLPEAQNQQLLRLARQAEGQASNLGASHVHPITTLAPLVLELRAYWQDLLGRPAPLRAETRPGRNDPCSCGSGKKYKHCCMG